MTLVVLEEYSRLQKHNIPTRFIKKHFCGGFLYQNMAAPLNGLTEGLFSFGVVQLGWWMGMGRREVMKNVFRQKWFCIKWSVLKLKHHNSEINLSNNIYLFQINC